MAVRVGIEDLCRLLLCWLERNQTLFGFISPRDFLWKAMGAQPLRTCWTIQNVSLLFNIG
jgi:hypothetical protein